MVTEKPTQMTSRCVDGTRFTFILNLEFGITSAKLVKNLLVKTLLLVGNM